MTTLQPAESQQLIFDLLSCPVRVPDTWEQSKGLMSRCAVAAWNIPVIRRLLNSTTIASETDAIRFLSEMVMVTEHLKLIGDCLPSVVSNDTRDAERYRKLRALHHEDGGLVVTLVKNVRLGSDCPSGDRLDEMIDNLTTPQASG